jgi:hypothetical protein
MNMIFFSFLNFYDSKFNKLIPLLWFIAISFVFNSFSSDKKFFIYYLIFLKIYILILNPLNLNKLLLYQIVFFFHLNIVYYLF